MNKLEESHGHEASGNQEHPVTRALRELRECTVEAGEKIAKQRKKERAIKELAGVLQYQMKLVTELIGELARES